jgi:diguanylate cyclase (GGDEF)-like protein/PAS domain S-box-containing protein
MQGELGAGAGGALVARACLLRLENQSPFLVGSPMRVSLAGIVGNDPGGIEKDSKRDGKEQRMAAEVIPSMITHLNLQENSDSAAQQEILDALPVLVFLERAGRIVYANAEARQMLGLADEKWVQRPVEEVLWGLFPGTAEPQTLLTGTRRGSPFHATMPAKDGRLLPVEGTYSIVDPELGEAVIVAHPGGRGRAPKSRLMEDVLASIPEAVVIVHSGHVLYTNAAFTRMFGYTAEEVCGGSLRELIVPETRQHEMALLDKTMELYGSASLETVRRSKDGELVDVALLTGPLMVNGEKVGYVLSYRDIGGRKLVEAKLQHDAMHDPLTGLPNRALFMDRVSLALARRLRRRDQSCAVLFLDLDRFKDVNDSLGHAAGDELLSEFSKRLSSALRPQDTAARLGGDEFAILIENIQPVADIEIVAGRILHQMDRPFEVYGHTVHVPVSIGAAMAGPEYTDPEMLIRDADFAMYRAKQNGGRRFELFDPQLVVQVTDRQEREREVRHVLDKREFEIWYQPIYRLRSGALEGFESLLRRRRADGCVESFRGLLPVAEDTGLSVSLGRETLESVCTQLRNWTGALPQSDLTLCVNVSHRQFFHPGMIAQVEQALAATGADPARLLFEISETTLSENPDAALAILQQLAGRKVRVAVDNFGSGQASLNHLMQMPIDALKLDPKFTAAATSTGRQVAVLESIILLGASLGVQVIAQGIETQEQLDALSYLGCELGQGHLLSRALDLVQAEKLAAQRPWKMVTRL